MKQEYDSGFYRKHIDEVNKPINVDVMKLTVFAEGDDDGFYFNNKLTAYTDGDNYFIKTENGIYYAELKGIREYSYNGTINKNGYLEFYDGLHLWTVNVFINAKYPKWTISSANPKEIPACEEWIKPGDMCKYRNIAITFIDGEHIKIAEGEREKIIECEHLDGYTVKMLKTKIKGKYGAYGIFQFCDHEAAEEQYRNHATFGGYIGEMRDRYLKEV